MKLFDLVKIYFGLISFLVWIFISVYPLVFILYNFENNMVLFSITLILLLPIQLIITMYPIFWLAEKIGGRL